MFNVWYDVSELIFYNEHNHESVSLYLTAYEVIENTYNVIVIYDPLNLKYRYISLPM